MENYKIYRQENYIKISSKQDWYGLVKDVFVDKSNVKKPEYRFFNVKDWKSNIALSIGQIQKEDGSFYTEQEFDAFYRENTGNFKSPNSGAIFVEVATLPILGINQNTIYILPDNSWNVYNGVQWIKEDVQSIIYTEVATLPTTNIKTNIIYILPSGSWNLYNGVNWLKEEVQFVVVNTYDNLPISPISNKWFWVSNAQGTNWLPGSLGGTYYPKGVYYFNGVNYEYIETPYQATQIEVDAGINNDKFVTPNTLIGWWTNIKTLAQTISGIWTWTNGAVYSPLINPTYAKGLVFYDNSSESLAYYDDINGTTVNLGQEQLVRARNNTGFTIVNGSVVYITGAIGQNPTIALARANSLNTSIAIGVATHDIPNNTIGKVTTFGIINDLNTSAYTDGQLLYLSSSVAGELTTIVPSSPNYTVYVCSVLHAHITQGKIFVRPEQPIALNVLLTDDNKVSPSTTAVKTYADTKVTDTIVDNVTGVAPSQNAVFDALSLKANTDAPVLYHVTRWFTPTSTVSNVSATVTSVGTQFTSVMVGSKLTINGETRIISGYTSTTVVTVNSPYSTNYSGVAAANWGVYSKAYEILSGFSRFIDSVGTLVFRTAAGNNVELSNGLSAGTNAGFFSDSFSLRSDYRFLFSSTSSAFGTKDLGFRRNSAGILEIYDGVTATGLLANRRDLLVRNISANYLALNAGGTTPNTAPLKLTTQVAPLTIPEQGTFELVGNSLQFSQLVKRRGVAMSQGVILSDTQIQNTIVESGALILAEHGANYLEVGKCEEIVIRGTIEQTSVGSGQMQIRVKYAGITLQTIQTNAGNIAVGTPFEIRISSTCRSVGVSGTMHFHSVFWIDGLTNIADSTALTTIDTTTPQSTTVTAKWTVANISNNFIVNQGRVLCIEPNK